MIVVDANVWVAISAPTDRFHIASRRWIAAAIRSGDDVAAPGIVLAEVAAAIARPSGDVQAADSAVQTVLATPRMTVVSVDHQLGGEAARLAADLGLRGCDAVYVALAARLPCPLVTWDGDIIKRVAGRVDARNPTS